MNTAQSVGNLMRELSRVAFTTGAAIVVVCHLTKNAFGKEIDRHLGSSDIINAARSVLSATRESEDNEIITVKHLKSTLAKRAMPFYYEIVGNGVIEFMSSTDADEDDYALPAKKEKKIDKAKRVLKNMLAAGALPQSEVKDEFERLDICSWRTVEEAKSELDVEQFWEGDVSCWRLRG